LADAAAVEWSWPVAGISLKSESADELPPAAVGVSFSRGDDKDTLAGSRSPAGPLRRNRFGSPIVSPLRLIGATQ